MIPQVTLMTSPLYLKLSAGTSSGEGLDDNGFQAITFTLSTPIETFFFSMKRWKTMQRKQTHSLQVDNDLAIKGKFRHNNSEHIALAALATHSSTGNMVLRSDRSVFPELVATRPIAKGEQLSFDYGPSYFAVPRDFSRGSTG